MGDADADFFSAVDVNADGDSAATDITYDSSYDDVSATDVDAVDDDTSTVIDEDTHAAADNADRHYVGCLQ